MFLTLYLREEPLAWADFEHSIDIKRLGGRWCYRFTDEAMDRAFDASVRRRRASPEEIAEFSRLQASILPDGW